MTDTDRLAAALCRVHRRYAMGPGYDELNDPYYERAPALAAAIIAADPTIICPDPADHALAAKERERSNRLLQLLEAAYRMEHGLSRGYGHVKDFEDCGSHDCPGRRRILTSLEDKP